MKENGLIDSESIMNAIQLALGDEPMDKGSNWIGGFGHIVGAYAAGYYSYLWS